MSDDASERFPLHESRELVRGLFKPNPLIYWTDFPCSMIVGWTAFALAVKSPFLSAGQLVFYFVAVLALYRAVIFIHELAHLRAGTFGLFRLVWNLTCGCPLMVPSFTYRGVHSEHHRQDIYGTRADGEYVPFAVQKPFSIVAYVSLFAILPLLFAVRFVVLTPLTWFSRPLADWTWARASSLMIDFTYRRQEATKAQCPTWRLQGLGAFLYGVSAIFLVAKGILSYKVLVMWYCVAALIFLLNSLRTLAAHRYRNPGDRRMSIPQQFLDSVDVPGNRFLTALWAPVGLRYHATHHLFPSMPYHALGEAHRLLTERLSDNALYLEATRTSLWNALKQLWNEARTA